MCNLCKSQVQSDIDFAQENIKRYEKIEDHEAIHAYWLGRLDQLQLNLKRLNVMHFCHEELFMILSALPIVGFIWTKARIFVRTKILKKTHHECSCENATNDH